MVVYVNRKRRIFVKLGNILFTFMEFTSNFSSKDLCKWKQCSTPLIVFKIRKKVVLVDGIKWNCTKFLVDKEAKVLEFEQGRDV
ncbi:hypothetical protein L1987_02823 [Smallanthus sonchifolius]|uniref:Uncharacterized protein n=1 Tax=Smallanthus sonchifolius TaxID=185202 RepID=A0ACB9K922_9ASTR|nr:hypothetical protein L1987_02823 [Smallanthus sonchifolius]